MKNKTILGSWCSEPNCKFIDDKHIQIELLAHIWYSYDNDSKTDVINKKLCFIKEIGFNELNDEIEILDNEDEDKKIPEKLNLDKDELLKKVIITAQDYVIEGKINEIIDYLKSEGE